MPLRLQRFSPWRICWRPSSVFAHVPRLDQGECGPTVGLWRPKRWKGKGPDIDKFTFSAVCHALHLLLLVWKKSGSSAGMAGFTSGRSRARTGRQDYGLAAFHPAVPAISFLVDPAPGKRRWRHHHRLDCCCAPRRT